MNREKPLCKAVGENVPSRWPDPWARNDVRGAKHAWMEASSHCPSAVRDNEKKIRAWFETDSDRDRRASRHRSGASSMPNAWASHTIRTCERRTRAESRRRLVDRLPVSECGHLLCESPAIIYGTSAVSTTISRGGSHASCQGVHPEEARFLHTSEARHGQADRRPGMHKATEVGIQKRKARTTTSSCVRSMIAWMLADLMATRAHAQSDNNSNNNNNEDMRWKSAWVLKSARCSAKEGEIVEGYVDSCGVCNGDGGSCSTAAVVLLVLTVIGVFGLLFVWARFMHVQVC
jgi:hypothetical protein